MKYDAKPTKVNFLRQSWDEFKPLPPVLQRIKDDLIARGKFTPSRSVSPSQAALEPSQGA